MGVTALHSKAKDSADGGLLHRFYRQGKLPLVSGKRLSRETQFRC